MGFIRIFERAGSRSGWHSVWDSRDVPPGEGWEAVAQEGDPAVWEVRLDGVPQGRVVAPPRQKYAAELGVGTDAVPLEGSSFSPHEPCEAVAAAYSAGLSTAAVTR